MICSRQIRRFLNLTKEVVFLNIHRFNPEKERTIEDSLGHQKLKLQLNKIFKDYMVPISNESSTSYTLKECWKENKKIFISYNHKSYKLDPNLWPGVRVSTQMQTTLLLITNFLIANLVISSKIKYDQTNTILNS